jgi:hypothetical protein
MTAFILSQHQMFTLFQDKMTSTKKSRRLALSVLAASVYALGTAGVPLSDVDAIVASGK